MSLYGEIDPIRSKEEEIPGAWLYPRYTDRRFTECRTEGLTIFLAQEAALTSGGFDSELVEGAFYNYSDRIHHGYSSSLVERASQEAERETGNKSTAAYFEAKLRIIYDEPTTELLHIIAGVNRGNGYPFQIFGTVSGSSPER